MGHGVTSVASMDTESDTVSVFSSIGPSSGIDFKPATLPGYLGGRGVMSGASMALLMLLVLFALNLK